MCDLVWARIHGPSAPMMLATALLALGCGDAGRFVVTSVTVDPSPGHVKVGETLQLTATAISQHGTPMGAAFTWSVSGGGTIDQSGLFTADFTPGGPHTVTATCSSVSGTAQVSVFDFRLTTPTGGEVWTRGRDETVAWIPTGAGGNVRVEIGHQGTDPLTRPQGEWTGTTVTSRAPSPRWGHSAVWTGSHMVVWGGHDDQNRTCDTGGFYDPIEDKWVKEVSASAFVSPWARERHAAVWTGSRMIVWGGKTDDGGVRSGYVYNPFSDVWESRLPDGPGLPEGHASQCAVWDGLRMMVWGGADWASGDVNTGAIYNLVADIWEGGTATDGFCPTPRRDHSGVWDGSRMIVWGGYQLSTHSDTASGALYEPVSDMWTSPTSTAGPCPTGLRCHSAVWTGSRMIVWGGHDHDTATNVDTGAAYDPTTDTWEYATSASGTCPAARERHSAVWTGTRMLVWGGELPGVTDSGAFYDPPGWHPQAVLFASTPDDGSEVVPASVTQGLSVGTEYRLRITHLTAGASDDSDADFTILSGAPGIAASATATPNPVVGDTTLLSVLGSDDSGEALLTYTWSAVAGPPGAEGPVYSDNGTNSAKACTATFDKAGDYDLRATVTDVNALFNTSGVVVVVQQTFTSIAVSPASVTVEPTAQLLFEATALDQFGRALEAQPAFTWSVTGGGTIDIDGLFTAGGVPGGPFVVEATSGAKMGTAGVKVGNDLPVVVVTTPSGTQTGDVTITYDLADLDGDDCAIEVRYLGGSVGAVWTPASTSGVTSGIAPGGGLGVTWNSATDEPGLAGADYQIQVRANDGAGWGGWGETAAFDLDNSAVLNAPPAVVVATPAGVQTGNVTVSYDLIDPDSPACSIEVQYIGGSGGGTWTPATVAGVTDGLSPAAGLTVVWNSGIDEAGQSASDYRVRIRACDGLDHGGWNETASFDVDNPLSGTLIWARLATGPGNGQSPLDVAMLSDGSAAITGEFRGSLTFAPGEPEETTLTCVGDYNGFLARYGADGTLAWARAVEAPLACGGTGIAAFDDDSIAAAGWFCGNALFGPGEPAEIVSPYADRCGTYLARYDSAGSPVWVACAGEGAYSGDVRVATTAGDSAYVSGYFKKRMSFGPGEPGETTVYGDGSYKMFLARYNSDGTVAWGKSAAGSTSQPYGLAALPDGSSFVVGAFRQTMTLDVGRPSERSLTSAGNSDIFLARVNADGSLAWAARAGGASGGQGLSVAALPDGSAIVTGVFHGTAVFGQGEINETSLTAPSLEDEDFLARYNSDGTLAWAKRAGGVGRQRATDVSALPDGSAVIVGDFTGTAVFGLGEPGEVSLAPAAGYGVFVARYNPDGTVAWARCVDGPAGWSCVAFDTDGSIVIAAGFNGTIVLGPGEPGETSLTSMDSEDAFIARFNP